ncbi:MAG TPA: hypothetical protein DD381_08180 [Lentisphaeria bacterium]|nr:hypothetical protein [Lentisphaeria bacterium]
MKLLLKEAEKYCRQNHIASIVLKASDSGRPIYKTYGFKPSPSFMTLDIILKAK